MQLPMTKYYENGDIITEVVFKPSGYGLDAQMVYHKIVTTFSIADGIIKDREYVPCKVFCR